MLQFELEAATATLVNFNPSTEKNGPDDMPFTALRISFARPSEDLAFFAPHLRSTFFDTTGPKDLADGLPLRDKHAVYPLKRDEEMHGAMVTIDWGVNTKIALADATLKDFQLTPMEGGTVVIACTVICHPDPDKDVPALYRLQRRGITVDITPADPADLPEMQEAA